MAYKKTYKKVDSYQVITDKIMEQLEIGVIPWQKTWSGGDRPTNLISKKPYQGINAFLLGCSPYSSKYFLTYNQAKKLGGNVRKGEKSMPVVLWKFLESKNKETGKKETFPMLKHFSVFNVDQCDGITLPVEETKQLDFKPIERCEETIKGYIGKPEIRHEEQRAFYSPSCDYINMPKKESFISENDYYSVLFHEAVHSTGHGTRLNREEVTGSVFFGSHSYSKEELVAEIGATFLCSETGIEGNFDNSASYINGWLKKLRSDKKFIISAASKARKAVEKIIGKKKDETEVK